MSLRLKAILVIFQVSFLMWTAIIYAGYSLTVASTPQVDYIATASTE